MFPQSTLTHLECSRCDAPHSHEQPINLCPCGGILLARYDLVAAARTLTRESLAARSRSVWRWSEVMPARDPERAVTLGEGSAPIVRTALGDALGIDVWLMDESLEPTGSFKARGMAAAVTRLVELGVTRAIAPTAGNAGLALAAYAGAAGIAARIVVPRDAPNGFVRAYRLLGAEVVEVDGTIADAGRAAAVMVREEGFFDLSTLKEPYRLEGKKTMGYELWEVWPELPDAIVYPTGGGTGLIGFAKAFAELRGMGLLTGRAPRLYAVQAEGCAPVVAAWKKGAAQTEPWPAPATLAAGLRVPSPYGGSLILAALRESGGGAIAVSDTAILEATRELARRTGRLLAPEAGATLAALPLLAAAAQVRHGERVLLVATGSAQLYLDTMELDGPAGARA